MTTCSGIDATTGAGTEITFNGNIESVRPGAAEPSMWIAPGWVDIQVNGFAGVDYNSAATPHEEIARSVQVQYAAGMTRFSEGFDSGAGRVGAVELLAAGERSVGAFGCGFSLVFFSAGFSGALP